MEAIVAIDSNWGIGYRGELLLRLPPDLRRFRALTLGRTVVFGRRTLETFPGRRPLPERRNLILSRRAEFSVEGAEVFSSVDALCAVCPDDAMVIGGQSVYEALLPRCGRVHLTRMHIGLPADARFPRLDRLPGWRRTARSDTFLCGEMQVWFETWENEKRRK